MTWDSPANMLTMTVVLKLGFAIPLGTGKMFLRVRSIEKRRGLRFMCLCCFKKQEIVKDSDSESVCSMCFPQTFEPHYPQKLALTSPTCGYRSVGIVRSRTHTTEF
jgi:hypothetical protein